MSVGHHLTFLGSLSRFFVRPIIQVSGGCKSWCQAIASLVLLILYCGIRNITHSSLQHHCELRNHYTLPIINIVSPHCIDPLRISLPSRHTAADWDGWSLIMTYTNVVGTIRLHCLTTLIGFKTTCQLFTNRLIKVLFSRQKSNFRSNSVACAVTYLLHVVVPHH